MLEEKDFDRLAKLALEARSKAYCPYSNYHVGAALLCSDGTVFTGCNVENASYPCSICAERVAGGKAVSEGHRDFAAIAVVGSGEGICTPCGMCRQFLSEFNPRMDVVCCFSDGRYEVMNLADLLYGAFTPESLS